jgi:Pyridoxamine 5'-phosphate oxidase
MSPEVALRQDRPSPGVALAHCGEKYRISWNEIEAAAPPIAERVKQRLEATRVALLGTVRSDGSPRISPVEPYFSQGQLLFGAMVWSRKTRDLLADPRCVLHSAITAPDVGEPEAKLYGRAIEAPNEIRDGCSAGWWQACPTAATVFSLTIERATCIEWNLEQGQMTVRSWSLRDGLTESSRSYP